MKIAVVTNMPAPYRLPIYEIMKKRMGDDFLVMYAIEREPNRSWNLGELKFNHLFLKENYKAKKDGFNFVHNNLDVFKELKSYSPDVIITTGYNPTFIYAWLFAKLSRKKHILFTDGWLGSEKGLSFIHKGIRSMIVRTSHAFLGVGKNGTKLYTHYGAKKEQLFQSELCVDNSRFANELAFENRPYDLMFSGQFTDRKDPLLFADIAIEVSKSIPNLRLLILGEGPLKEKFMQKLNDAGIEYDYPGYATQEDLPSYYASSKLFLFPTKLDAWGVVVNEAMASGTPVLSTPYAGVVDDLVIDGESGYNLELDVDLWSAKAKEILGDKVLWKNLSEGAINRVQDFNFDDAAQGIIDAATFTLKK